MLRFESLLLKELQKQQNRDEFCDTVLQSQGVSVPVHSCVLSAFSPKLSGTLSSMPGPMAGQRRLIELHSLDACTLVSLVTLFYSGQLHDNIEQVLCAAKSLGFEVPQQNQAEMNKGKKRQRGVKGGAEHKEVDEDSRRKQSDSGTQTEYGRQTDERETQTDSQSFQTLYVMSMLTDQTNQEPSTYPSGQDATSTLQTIHPEKMPSTCDVLAMVPEKRGYHTVGESACEIYLYSTENTDDQQPNTVAPQPLLTHNTYVAQPGPKGLAAVEGSSPNQFEQFEENIPGIISSLLEPDSSQIVGKRGRGRPRGVARGEGAVKRATVRSRGGGMVRNLGGGRQQKCTGRLGWVPRLAWSGQGGGRVGRKVDTRSMRKNPASRVQRRRGRGSMVNKEEKRGKTGIHADSKRQDTPPCVRRPRGRPRIHPLPHDSHPFCNQKTVASPDSTLLHTMPLPMAPQPKHTQPMDHFLDDPMTGLHFLPFFPAENQDEYASATTHSVPFISNTVYPTQSAKPPDLKQPAEGELSDILDHFLRTFEQQVVGCSADVGTEMLQDPSVNLTTMEDYGAQVSGGRGESVSSTNPVSNTAKTCTHLEPSQTSNIKTFVTMSSKAQNQHYRTPGLKEPSSHRHGSELEKPSGDENKKESKTRMITRSQTMKRKLDTALISTLIPYKRKCTENLISGRPEKKRTTVRRLSHRQAHMCSVDACQSQDRATKLNPSEISTTKSLEKRQKQMSTAAKTQKVNRHGIKSKIIREVKDGVRKGRLRGGKVKLTHSGERGRSLKAEEQVVNCSEKRRSLEDGIQRMNVCSERRSLEIGRERVKDVRRSLQKNRYGMKSCGIMKKTPVISCGGRKTFGEERQEVSHCEKRTRSFEEERQIVYRCRKRRKSLEDARHKTNDYNKRKNLKEGIQEVNRCGERKTLVKGRDRINNWGKRKGLMEEKHKLSDCGEKKILQVNSCDKRKLLGKGKNGVNCGGERKTLCEGSSKVNHCLQIKKSLDSGEGAKARHKAAGSQKSKSSQKNPTGAMYNEMASSTVKKVNVLQIQKKNEDHQRVKDGEEIREENEEVGNHRSAVGAEEGSTVQLYPGETRKREDEENSVAGVVKAQKKVCSARKMKQMQEKEETMSDGLRQEEPRAAEYSTPFKMDQPLYAAGSSEEDDDVDVLEISSPTSELAAKSTVVCGAGLSTDEESAEEDVEVDVLGVESS